MYAIVVVQSRVPKSWNIAVAASAAAAALFAGSMASRNNERYVIVLGQRIGRGTKCKGTHSELSPKIGGRSMVICLDLFSLVVFRGFMN